MPDNFLRRTQNYELSDFYRIEVNSDTYDHSSMTWSGTGNPTHPRIPCLRRLCQNRVFLEPSQMVQKVRIEMYKLDKPLCHLASHQRVQIFKAQTQQNIQQLFLHKLFV